MNQLRNGRYIETRIIETNKRKYLTDDEIEMLIKIEKREAAKVILEKYLSLSIEQRMELDIDRQLDGNTSIENHLNKALGGR
ncbi:hypothetical protein [Bacillus sp. AFS017336]|uniref:hypothetical protein n=1 Tax=Bacillus sp. AFS017336 TaxID=2033489 RepID=UPI000BEFA75F|nr:hypothetical protein [Bacillus sp. AFS017336]PEL13214.1 hypothetical protein CN601_04990 [Bacillus sp. AFS017336]